MINFKKNEEDPKNTIFAKMVTGVIKTDPVYEDDYVLIIKDINPQAPIHLLILPKKAPIGKLTESTGTFSTKTNNFNQMMMLLHLDIVLLLLEKSQKN